MKKGQTAIYKTYTINHNRLCLCIWSLLMKVIVETCRAHLYFYYCFSWNMSCTLN